MTILSRGAGAVRALTLVALTGSAAAGAAFVRPLPEGTSAKTAFQQDNNNMMIPSCRRQSSSLVVLKDSETRDTAMDSYLRAMEYARMEQAYEDLEKLKEEAVNPVVAASNSYATKSSEAKDTVMDSYSRAIMEQAMEQAFEELQQLNEEASKPGGDTLKEYPPSHSAGGTTTGKSVSLHFPATPVVDVKSEPATPVVKSEPATPVSIVEERQSEPAMMDRKGAQNSASKDVTMKELMDTAMNSYRNRIKVVAEKSAAEYSQAMEEAFEELSEKAVEPLAASTGSHPSATQQPTPSLQVVPAQIPQDEPTTSFMDVISPGAAGTLNNANAVSVDTSTTLEKESVMDDDNTIMDTVVIPVEGETVDKDDQRTTPEWTPGEPVDTATKYQPELITTDTTTKDATKDPETETTIAASEDTSYSEVDQSLADEVQSALKAYTVAMAALEDEDSELKQSVHEAIFGDASHQPNNSNNNKDVLKKSWKVVVNSVRRLIEGISEAEAIAMVKKGNKKGLPYFLEMQEPTATVAPNDEEQP